MPQKPWKRSRKNKRNENVKNKRKLLILCEGERTEPQYFEKFPVDKEVISVDIEGTGRNTDSLVQEAINRKEQAKQNGKPYNQVWCVFDRDSFPAHNFNRAFLIAESNDIKIAYSNEAFELWYLLHFSYYNTPISRTTYRQRLSPLLSWGDYQKNDPRMYEELFSMQSVAIANAKRLLGSYSYYNPEEMNPSTNVYKLVILLNELKENLE